jgi:hypothetical protein
MMMSASPEALIEMKILDLDEEKQPSAHNGINTEADDIAADRRCIQEISKMADRMSSLLQESRKTNAEADERLRQVEADLKLIALEK